MTSPASDTGRTAEEMREQVARCLCIAVGEDPDRVTALALQPPHPRAWRKHLKVADALLAGPLAPVFAEIAQLRSRLLEAEKGGEISGRDPDGSGHPAEPEPASGLGPSDGCPSRGPAEADPPRPFKEVLPEAYGWLVDADGYLWGLTAGDMGYDQTDMRLVELFDLAIEAEWHRFQITHEKKWPVHEITLDFISTLAAALGIEAAVPPEPKGPAEGESPTPQGGMPEALAAKAAPLPESDTGGRDAG